MRSNQNAMARALLDGISNVDRETLSSLFAPVVNWHLPKSAWQDPLKTHDEMVEFLLDVSGSIYVPGSIRYSELNLIEQGPFVAIQATISATMINGQEYENQYVYVLKFDGDGLIEEVWEYLDAAYFHELFSKA